MREYYCWKCARQMPFLEEDEWQQVSPLLTVAIRDIKEYREKTGSDLSTTRAIIKPKVTKIFEKITGMPNIHFDTINHHRLSDWGPECAACNELLRTKDAKICANCGEEKN